MANKAAAQSSRRVKCFLNNLRARMGRVPSGVGLKARNELKKKYPLIISDERVLPSHLNLMTLASFAPAHVNTSYENYD
jgi:hypothetical protein